MKVQVKTCIGKIIKLQIALSTTILEMKKMIQDKQGIPPEQQRLIFLPEGKPFSYRNFTELTDDFSINQVLVYECEEEERFVAIQENSKLYLYLNLRGGCPPLSFNGFDQQITREFVSTGGRWRIIRPGLNLEGFCKNRACEAFGKMTWISKGYGNFNLSRQVHMSKCPLCQHFCEKIVNMSLYMGRCKTKGMKMSEENEIETIREHRDRTNHLTFKNSQESIIQWKFLELEVSQL